jgi:nucleoid-associated protein YgaU
MARSRYNNKSVDTRKFLFKLDKKTKRKKNITFYNTINFEALTDEGLDELEIEEINFAATDTLMGLAQKFYGDPSYWWVIALINNVGSEADITLGQQLVVFSPLSALLPELGL